jgi:hypothetical protein
VVAACWDGDSAIWEQENGVNRKIPGAPSRADAWPWWIPTPSRIDDQRSTTVLAASFSRWSTRPRRRLANRPCARVFCKTTCLPVHRRWGGDCCMCAQGSLDSSRKLR